MMTCYWGRRNSLVSCDTYEFSEIKQTLIYNLKETVPVHRGTWQSEDVSISTSHATFELANVILEYRMPETLTNAQRAISPDLPWAEDHFQERISGKPLNPPPSFSYWPHHRGNEDKHLEEGKFSHTYPERMWPKYTKTVSEFENYGPQQGIRFTYGDLNDVILQLKKNPWSRQAYLPIWFPEDTGSLEGQRVPCTLGYHFIKNGDSLDCNYFIRSCDIYRHFTNDVYLATRLTQYILDQLNRHDSFGSIGTLTMFISNLHLFQGDVWRLS